MNLVCALVRPFAVQVVLEAAAGRQEARGKWVSHNKDAKQQQAKVLAHAQLRHAFWDGLHNSVQMCIRQQPFQPCCALLSPQGAQPEARAVHAQHHKQRQYVAQACAQVGSVDERRAVQDPKRWWQLRSSAPVSVPAACRP